jgi:hypothetical protein
MNQNKNNETALKSRVHHFNNELLLDAWYGLKRRYGQQVENFSLDGQELLTLVAASPVITGTIEDNYLWAKEVMAEIKARLAKGSISLPVNNVLKNQE